MARCRLGKNVKQPGEGTVDGSPWLCQDKGMQTSKKSTGGGGEGAEGRDLQHWLLDVSVNNHVTLNRAIIDCW